jgi:phenylacetate-CoA ligase
MFECGTIGRYDDMMKIRGNNVWPMVVDDNLFSHPEIAEYRGKVGIGSDGKDEVMVQVAFRPTIQAEPTEDRQRLLNGLRDHLKRVINITVAIEEVPSLPDFEYKARRWVDERHADLGQIGGQLASRSGDQR